MILIGTRTMKFLARPVIAPTKVTPMKMYHLSLPAGPKKLLRPVKILHHRLVPRLIPLLVSRCTLVIYEGQLMDLLEGTATEYEVTDEIIAETKNETVLEEIISVEPIELSNPLPGIEHYEREIDSLESNLSLKNTSIQTLRRKQQNLKAQVKRLKSKVDEKSTLLSDASKREREPTIELTLLKGELNKYNELCEYYKEQCEILKKNETRLILSIARLREENFLFRGNEGGGEASE